jgi:hypothetical protein
MCFSAEILRRFEWRWFTLAEDVEFHLELIGQGIPVQFAWETWVKADMPVTLSQASSQNERWEGGRAQLARKVAPRLIWGGLRRRDWRQIDAAFEQLIPPLSVPFVMAAAAIAGGLMVENQLLSLLACACLAGYAGYLITALILVRASARVYFALSVAPVYILWKVGLYARSLFSAQSSWVRTARVP